MKMKFIHFIKNSTARFFMASLLLAGLSIIFGKPSLAAGIHTLAGEAHSLYLPIVMNPPLVRQVVNSSGDSPGYPGYVWLNGYVMNVVSQPVYSVAIRVEYLHFPYCEPPEPCEPSRQSEIIYPVFPATLSGQLNPFVWEFQYSKDWASWENVEIQSASLDNHSGKSYYPLAVLSWQRQDKTILGRVRNDSGKTLEEARLLVFPGECNQDEYFTSNICRYREAALTKTGLQPGEEADFRVENFSYAGDDLVVVGQGSKSP